VRLQPPKSGIHGEYDFVASTRRFVSIALAKQSDVVTISIVTTTIRVVTTTIAIIAVTRKIVTATILVC